MGKIKRFAISFAIMAIFIGMTGCSTGNDTEVKETVATPTFSVASGTAVDFDSTVTLSVNLQ